MRKTNIPPRMKTRMTAKSGGISEFEEQLVRLSVDAMWQLNRSASTELNTQLGVSGLISKGQDCK